MQPIQWKASKVIDGHVHFRKKETLEHFKDIIDIVSYNKVNILGGRGPASLGQKHALGRKAYQVLEKVMWKNFEAFVRVPAFAMHMN